MQTLSNLVWTILRTITNTKPFPICDKCPNDFHRNYIARQVVGDMILRYTCVCGHVNVADFNDDPIVKRYDARFKS